MRSLIVSSVLALAAVAVANPAPEPTAAPQFNPLDILSAIPSLLSDLPIPTDFGQFSSFINGGDFSSIAAEASGAIASLESLISANPGLASSIDGQISSIQSEVEGVTTRIPSFSIPTATITGGSGSPTSSATVSDQGNAAAPTGGFGVGQVAVAALVGAAALL